MSCGQGERKSFGSSISMNWGGGSDEGYPSVSEEPKAYICRVLQCPRCCGLGAIIFELKGRAGNFCTKRVCIYRLTCENSCRELITGSCFHTGLTYPDCKAIKLHTVMLELDVLRTVIQRCLSWLFPCIPSCVPCPIASHPLSQKLW